MTAKRSSRTTDPLVDVPSTQDPLVKRYAQSPLYKLGEDNLRKALCACTFVRVLSMVLFLLGIAFLGSALYVGVFGETGAERLVMILSGVGTINLISLLIYKPLKRIEESTEGLLRAEMLWLTYRTQWDTAARAVASLAELPMGQNRASSVEGLKHEFDLLQRAGEMTLQLVAELGKPAPFPNHRQLEGGEVAETE